MSQADAGSIMSKRVLLQFMFRIRYESRPRCAGQVLQGRRALTAAKATQVFSVRCTCDVHAGTVASESAFICCPTGLKPHASCIMAVFPQPSPHFCSFMTSPIHLFVPTWLMLLIPAAGPTGAAGTTGLDGATGFSLTRLPNNSFIHTFSRSRCCLYRSH